MAAPSGTPTSANLLHESTSTAMPSETSTSRAKKLRTPPSLVNPQSSMVTILVGPEKAKFVVHQDFLTYHSPYFARCLEGNFNEATTKVVELDHTTSEAFGLFVNWIYTKEVNPCEEIEHKSNDGKGKVGMFSVVKPQVDLWILADYLQIPELQNAAMDRLYQTRNRTRCRGTFEDTYNRTTVGSMMRKFWINDSAAKNVAWFQRKNSENAIPPEMMFDILIAVKERSVTKSKLQKLSMSDFHVVVETKEPQEN